METCIKASPEEGMIFVVLRAYFDGSEAADKSFLTLACLAATDEVWADLKAAWEEVRATRGNPHCMHMTDAMSLRGEFTNWSKEDRNFLVDGFLNVLVPLRVTLDCTPSLARLIYRRWKDARHHPTPNGTPAPSAIRNLFRRAGTEFRPMWFHQGWDLAIFNTCSEAVRQAFAALHQGGRLTPPQSLQDWERHCRMWVLMYGAYFEAFGAPGQRYVGGGADVLSIPWPDDL